MMRLIRFVALCVFLPVYAQAGEPPRVVGTILPLHSLATAVMEGIATPDLLLEPGASPHAYTLKPSQARMLSRADLIIWIGPGLENFLIKTLADQSIADRVMTVAGLPGINSLNTRVMDSKSGIAIRDVPGKIDAHYWLDPGNARVIVQAIANTLSAIDSERADRYQRNAQHMIRQLDILDRDIAMRLGPYKNVPFIAWHDAYHYFEHRYGLKLAGFVTENPERRPGARTLLRLRALIQQETIGCVVSELPRDAGPVSILLEGSNAHSAVLDPVGNQLKPGREAYTRMLFDIALGFERCLGG
ncbi:MAG: zinc ABC transporter substrate-binding protein ZnuA [Gammaproteobacteria bacterium]|nr:MAG: zinc ABC transporter substrate-binding protein ZnuA [Gammaproteobacteria bacterium]